MLTFTFTVHRKELIGKRDVLDVRTRGLFLSTCNRCVTAHLTPLFNVELIRLYMKPVDHIHIHWKSKHYVRLVALKLIQRKSSHITV